MVRKGDGGVALSENLGDSIHGGRQLFRLLLCQVLTKTRVESPTRLNLFALDTRHDAHKLNIGPGGAPRAAAGGTGIRIACGVGRDCRGLAFKDADQSRNDSGDAECRRGLNLRVSRCPDRTGDTIAEIAIQIIFGRALLCNQESIPLVCLATLGYSGPIVMTISIWSSPAPNAGSNTFLS